MYWPVLLFVFGKMLVIYYDHDPQGFETKVECEKNLPGLITRAHESKEFNDFLTTVIPNGSFGEWEARCVDKPPKLYEQELRDKSDREQGQSKS